CCCWTAGAAGELLLGLAILMVVGFLLLLLLGGPAAAAAAAAAAVGDCDESRPAAGGAIFGVPLALNVIRILGSTCLTPPVAPPPPPPPPPVVPGPGCGGFLFFDGGRTAPGAGEPQSACCDAGAGLDDVKLPPEPPPAPPLLFFSLTF
ncbi:unnamed protein product, partial [Ectocarpus sp. 12 AP-2014]